VPELKSRGRILIRNPPQKLPLEKIFEKRSQRPLRCQTCVVSFRKEFEKSLAAPSEPSNDGSRESAAASGWQQHNRRFQPSMITITVFNFALGDELMRFPGRAINPCVYL
jgi:hypothetical protein